MFGGVSVTIFEPICNQAVFSLLSFESSLFILDNSPLSDVSFADSFSWSVACLFIVLTVSFPQQKILKEPSLSILTFQESCIGGVGRKSLLNPRSSRFSPGLSSRSIIVSRFMFRSAFQLESVLLKCVAAGSGSWCL